MKEFENDRMKFDDIYILPVGEYFIVHSPLRGISAFSNKMAVQYLYDILKLEQADNEKIVAIDYLLKAIKSSPPVYPHEPDNSISPYFLGLIPTRSCNGACIYCGFEHQGESNKNMDYRTAITAIDWMANHMVQLNKDKLEIHFFGGEPLFTPDIVSVAVHYTRMVAERKGLFPHFEVSTNGQVSEQTTRFVTDHFHSVILSLDGDEEIHNLQRPLRNGKNSFKQAVRFAEKISNSNSELCLRVCISSANIKMMPEITEWFCHSFQPSVINFENLKPNAKSNHADLQEPDPFQFARQFNLSLNIAEKYGIALINSSTSTDKPQFSSCPVGKDTLIVSPDGIINSCYLLPARWEQKGLDLAVGEINEGGMIVSQERIMQLRRMVKEKPRCASCFCKWTCAGGCHVDVTFPGSSDLYDNYCKQTRILGIMKILRAIDQHEVLNQFLQDDQQLKRFSMRGSDKLTDWSEHE